MSWLPENVSTYGADIDFIFYLIYYITAAVFVLVTVLMVAFLIMYRHREGRRAAYSHGNTALEIIWTVVPAVILIVLTFVSMPSWARIKIQIPESDLKIRVTAKQFNWEVQYPGPDGTFDTDDDKVFDNEIHVPVAKPVVLGLRSRDVIHSLFLPELRFKQDVVPGREILQWFEAIKPGKYEMPCAELCGFGHSGMKGWLYVHTPEEYAQWVKEEWP
ncbi:MAG: cytochrome c oxidase subunit II [Candidatus Methylomirabilia bacterium]